MSPAQVAIYAILLVALVISVITDVRSRKIKNVVTVPTFLLCLALRGLFFGFGHPLDGLGLASGLLGAAIGGGFFFVPALLGGVKAGDVKLALAVGAAVGAPAIVGCLICIGLVGGVQAIGALLLRGQLLATVGGMFRGLLVKARLAQPGPPPEKVWIPYGVAIAVGTVIAVWLEQSFLRAVELAPH